MPSMKWSPDFSADYAWPLKPLSILNISWCDRTVRENNSNTSAFWCVIGVVPSVCKANIDKYSMWFAGSFFWWLVFLKDTVCASLRLHTLWVVVQNMQRSVNLLLLHISEIVVSPVSMYCLRRNKQKFISHIHFHRICITVKNVNG